MRSFFGSRRMTLSVLSRKPHKIAALTASRRVIVDAYEIERRRIERDLHDGTQQYLVAAAMMLGEARTLHAVAEDATLAGLRRQLLGCDTPLPDPAYPQR